MKLVLLYFMAALYIAAGVNHFVNPKMYQDIMPRYLPYHLPLIYVSGIAEILFGVLLIPEATRSVAAWLIVALLIAVFPANVEMMITAWERKSSILWIAVLRLPLQLVLIWWAWLYTES